MSWKQTEDGVLRWSWEADDQLHLLVYAGGELRELHDTTVHVYAPTGANAEADAPLDTAKYVRTVAAPTAPATEAEAFAWLEQGRYDRG